MSMNATDAVVRSASATRCATVLLPEPVPPAIPMTRGRGAAPDGGGGAGMDVAGTEEEREARTLSRFRIAPALAADAGGPGDRPRNMGRRGRASPAAGTSRAAAPRGWNVARGAPSF